MTANDDDPHGLRPLFPAGDAHGQAALALVESLIHDLVGRAVLTTADAIEIVESAREVQHDVAEAADGAGAESWRAHVLLSSIAQSLEHDIADGSSQA